MRIAITGASGNVGTGVVRALRAALPQAELIGVCRRRPGHGGPPFGVMKWVPLDLANPASAPQLRLALDGCEAVVHLAWAIQSARDEDRLRAVNVRGTAAVCAAAAQVGVPQVVHASSLAVYSPGPGPVSEDAPAAGHAASLYSRQKVEVEGWLDTFEKQHPEVTVARIRPTLVTQRDAATHLLALFGGIVTPTALFRVLAAGRLPVVPLPEKLTIQLVHADDVGDAVARILQHRSAGPFNLAADPLDAAAMADVLRTRAVPVPRAIGRLAVNAAYRARLIGLSAGWYDITARGPVMRSDRAIAELGWKPARDSRACLAELLDGLATGASGPSPALRG